MERSWVILPVLILFLCSAGCVNLFDGEPPQRVDTPVPIPVPATETPRAPVLSSDMALQPSDLPSEYSLQDRSVMAFEDVSPLAIQLGWLQGYYVSFFRRNTNTNDVTFIRQTVNIYTNEDLGGLFLIEKDEMKSQQLTPGSRHEIPFPAVGERSIAFRETDPLDSERPVTYTVIFVKKNVFEKITMSGTNTDYETLKRLALKAESLIR